MMKRTKKITSFLLSVAMMIAMLPMTTFHTYA